MFFEVVVLGQEKVVRSRERMNLKPGLGLALVFGVAALLGACGLLLDIGDHELYPTDASVDVSIGGSAGSAATGGSAGAGGTGGTAGSIVGGGGGNAGDDG